MDSTEAAEAVNGNGVTRDAEPDLNRSDTQTSKDSQTASEFIDSQLQLEADAREILPYAFDSCTQPLGALRQSLFACLTCNPPPASPSDPYTPAGVCYSCSIACHGKHTLVELFNRRNFVCDCGTTRIQSDSPCTLRADPDTGVKGVGLQEPAEGNRYNQNFQNRFCGCGGVYDAHKEKGTMFQCLGLGTVETGGCGEDWWHPECVLGLPRDWHQSTNEKEEPPQAQTGRDEETAGPEHEEEESPVPPGFPDEDDFEHFVCYKCVESNSWIKRYAGTPGFLHAVYKQVPSSGEQHSTPPQTSVMPTASAAEDPVPPPNGSNKRKAEDDTDAKSSTSKRAKESTDEPPQIPPHKHSALPPAPDDTLSLFCKSTFRDHLCHCQTCFPLLIPHPQLLEEEENYEPPLYVSGDGENGHPNGSHGTGSLLDRGEAALSNVDRVRAIEGVLVYNHLKDKVKEFLKPFAESGTPVGAEDIKAYFEKLRGDEAAIKEAGGRPGTADGDGDGGGKDGDTRREQSGY